MSELATKGMISLVEAIPKILQLDRLERLSKRHPVCAISYMALIAQINSIIVATEDVTVGGFTIGPFNFGVEVYGADWKGKLHAISRSFRYEAERLHELMAVGVLSDLAQGVGFELSQTLNKSLEAMSKVVIALTKEAGKLTPEIIEKLLVLAAAA